MATRLRIRHIIDRTHLSYDKWYVFIKLNKLDVIYLHKDGSFHRSTKNYKSNEFDGYFDNPDEILTALRNYNHLREQVITFIDGWKAAKQEAEKTAIAKPARPQPVEYTHFGLSGS